MDEKCDPSRPALPPTLQYAQPPTSHDLREMIICFVFGIGLGTVAVFILIDGLMTLWEVFLHGNRRELAMLLPAVLLFTLIDVLCALGCLRCIRAGYRLWRR